MKNFYLLMLCLCGLIGNVQAQISGFTRAFAPSNWQLVSFTDSGNATINSSAAPTSVVFTGSDDPTGDGFGNAGAYDVWQITVNQTGTISFTYKFVNNDTNLIEYASYLVGANETIFAPQLTQSVFNGTISNVAVTSGQVFAFKIFNNDDLNGNGVLTLSNFQFTPTNPLQAASSITNVSCNGGSNGSVALTISGGVSPYTYSWSPSGGSGATASNLSVGNYTCTITDAATNQIAKNVTITQPSALTSGVSQTNVSCNGGSNGTATVTPSGGTSPYIFSWSPSGGNAATASNLVSGNYTCTITDSNGCTLPKNFTISQPTILVATTSQNDVSCNGGNNGNATVTPSGGTTPYTYSWSPGGGTTASVSGLTANTYTCTITDAKGCSLLKSFTISQPTVLTANTSQTAVSCGGGNDGTATVIPSGGTSPYTYQWSPSGGTGATATGLAAGNYTCTITDVKGCTLIKNFTITSVGGITATTTQTNVNCNGGNNGSASVTVSGGTSPYTYSWSPSGGTGATASGLVAGNYICTITDAKGCSLQKSVTITQPTVLTSGTSQANISCNGGNDGTATVAPSGGTAPYTYLWAPSGGFGASASNLTANNYTCTITDSKGCTLAKNFTITQPPVLTAATSQANVLCNGGNSGSATVTPSGGTPPFTYQWSPSGGTGATAVNLTANDYTCTITDSKGCVLIKNFTITQPLILTATTSQTDVACNGGSGGSASVVPSGGTSPYTYLWSPSGGTGSTATGLSAGNYSCTITDVKGCTLIKNFTIISVGGISATTTQTNVNCNGGNNGSATVTASGGTSPYTYSWSPSGGTGATASGLVAGIYTCTITDSKSCILFKSFTISQPSILVVETSQVNVSCNGGNNGNAAITPTGGTSPYQISFNGGAYVAINGSAQFNNLAVGVYNWIVKDTNGCSVNGMIEIIQPAQLTAITSSGNVKCNGGNDGSVTVTFSGGTSPYQMSFNGGASANVVSPSVHGNLVAGTYNWVITDAKGCAVNGSETVNQPLAIVANSAHTDLKCNASNDGSLTVTFSGGTPPYQLSLDSAPYVAAASPFTFNNLAADLYHWMVMDGNGCVASGFETVSQPDLPLIAQNTTVPMGDAFNSSLCLTDVSKILTLNNGTSGTIQWQTVVQEATPDNQTIWQDIVGETTAAYTIKTAVEGKNWFRLMLTPNGCNPVYSNLEYVYYKQCLSVVDISNPVFEVEVYPVPYKDAFSIKLNSLSGANVHINIYDMAGRLIEQRSVTPENLINLKLGESFPVGVYNLIITQENHSKTMRLIRD